MSHHLVGAAEAARILGVTRQRVAQLAVSPGFPAPEVTLSGGRIWRRHDIESWAARNEDRGDPRDPKSDQGWALHRLTRLAGDEADRLGHGHLGSEHMVLAMLRPEAPGVARQVLESFGVTLELGRERAVLHGGPRREGSRLKQQTTDLTVIVKWAEAEAEFLSDDVVSSQHVLLAICQGDDRPALSWLLEGVPNEWIRQRTQALSDAPLREEEPDPDFLRRRAKSAAVRQAKGCHVLDTYLPRSDGVDPTTRRPWGSMGWFGEAWRRPGLPLQYTVDCDGVPVLGPTGRLFTFVTDDEDFMVLDDEGFLRQEEFDRPEGATVEWPDGFVPPPGASPQLLS